MKEAKDFDTMADELLDKKVTVTPEGSSSEIKPEDDDSQGQDSGAEPEKTEQVKTIEEDESLTVEEKINKVKDILGDDEKAIDAYIKEKGYHNDPAWIKQRELIDRLKEEGKVKTALAEEDRAALDEFKEFRSSSEYIQTTMKAQGYTQDAIDKKLQEQGFDVQAKPQDDVNLVVDKLGIDLESMSPTDKASVMANISDVVKVADILINDRLGKVLPKELAPFKQNIEEMSKSDGASKAITTMKETVKSEGILDFDKDIEPALNKFMDDNPDATQQDVFSHFVSINHALTVERLKTGKTKEERDKDREQLRQNISISGAPKGVPTKTGDFDKDADAFLDKISM